MASELRALSLCGSQCDLCVSVVNNPERDFTTKTLRTTEAHREEISRYRFIVEPACSRCHEAEAIGCDRPNRHPALSPSTPGTACRDIRSPRVASAGTILPASLRRVPGTATFAHRAQSA